MIEEVETLDRAERLAINAHTRLDGVARRLDGITAILDSMLSRLDEIEKRDRETRRLLMEIDQKAADRTDKRVRRLQDHVTLREADIKHERARGQRIEAELAKLVDGFEPLPPYPEREARSSKRGDIQ